MKNKLIFRILGALASALIAVSVFIPFISVTGYSSSLWGAYEITNSLYLPIMIIVFGAIGVIFFALNIKTEFAYMSTGAITFFLVMQTINILDQGVFNTLGIGYYTLIIGTVLTGVMAFLTNLKIKNEMEATTPSLIDNQPTMLNQTDKVYNDQAKLQNEISPIQPITNVIEPIPVQPVDSIQTIPAQPVNSVKSTSVQPIDVAKKQVVEQKTNVVSAQPINGVVKPQVASNNPVLQEFARPVNPEIRQFSNTIQTQHSKQEVSKPQTNPQTVVQERPVVKPKVTSQPQPVLNEFTNSSLGELQQSSESNI